MKEEIQKVKAEVIAAQKEAVVKEVATLEMQLDFSEKEHEVKVKNAEALKDKEQKEAAVSSLAQHKLQRILPMHENIALKTNYYEYLCKL